MKIFLLILSIVFLNCCGNKNSNSDKANLSRKIIDTNKKATTEFKTENPYAAKSNAKQNFKKLTDTTVVLNFKNLSNVYNYRITDKYYCNRNQYHGDSVYRVIKIFNKNDSLIQRIYPNLQMVPWYFFENDMPSALSRSYVTGKNVNADVTDNYCGEIVVADLNFDGLEDFATPVDHGCDNGAHYAFYIQNSNDQFKRNTYLTENVTWFPEEINDSLLMFTNSVPLMWGIACQTFKYDTLSKKWGKTKDYVIDYRTGKIIR
ncbi:MAG TPA: hypothetical protein VFJ43_10280 [Bacteroidia bacterium]|nr:hypothetical protein [Bacteroidia bacterium]